MTNQLRYLAVVIKNGTRRDYMISTKTRSPVNSSYRPYYQSRHISNTNTACTMAQTYEIVGVPTFWKKSAYKTNRGPRTRSIEARGAVVSRSDCISNDGIWKCHFQVNVWSQQPSHNIGQCFKTFSEAQPKASQTLDRFSWRSEIFRFRAERINWIELFFNPSRSNSSKCKNYCQGRGLKAWDIFCNVKSFQLIYLSIVTIFF
jgi:hypothetical protein